jgi:hypothetical protein
VLLIDIDKSPWNKLMETVGVLLVDFIPGMEVALRGSLGELHNPFRVILAGRYLCRYRVDELPFKRCPLTPFGREPVRDAAKVFLGHKYAEQIVSHLMHHTGGHPGCMACVLDLYKRQGESPDQFFEDHADEILEGIVRKEAQAVRSNIPRGLSWYFDELSVFRYLSEDVLRIWMQDLKLPEFDCKFVDEFELADALVKSGLMAFENDLLRDNITRRLLAIWLVGEKEPRSFSGRCQQARRICQDYLQDPAVQRPSLWAIECLFQFLQGHAADIRDVDRRSKIRRDFFNKIVPQVLSLLTDNREPRGISRSLARALRADWEFQFTVNYYLRGEQYTAETYKRLEEDIDDFFATEAKEQKES